MQKPGQNNIARLKSRKVFTKTTVLNLGILMLLKIQMMLESTTEQKYVSRFKIYTKYRRKKNIVFQKNVLWLIQKLIGDHTYCILFLVFQKVYNFFHSYNYSSYLMLCLCVDN